MLKVGLDAVETSNYLSSKEPSSLFQVDFALSFDMGKCGVLIQITQVEYYFLYQVSHIKFFLHNVVSQNVICVKPLIICSKIVSAEVI